MDPYHRNQVNPGGDASYPADRSPGVSGNRQTPQDVERGTPQGNPQETDRQPRYTGAYTVIPPIESRRSKITTMAQKEEEDLRRWKETHKVPSVHLNPERLGGGGVTLAEAREKQFVESRNPKLQKKLKKEDMDRQRRQEEAEELQKMKAKQREKAEQLEQRRQQEEQRRREQLGPDHLRSTERFLQRFESAVPPAASGAANTSRGQGDDVERHQRQRPRSAREVQLEHQRVNSAFLDKLEGRGAAGRQESVEEAERMEDFRQRATAGHLKPDPDQSCSDWMEEAEPEPDYDWALMKLMNRFPDCSRDFLEDILEQCHGDFEAANKLLINTLS